MKFNAKAYDELYPRPKKVEKVETAVEGFTPSVETDVEKVTTETAVETESEVDNGGDGTDRSTSE